MSDSAKISAPLAKSRMTARKALCVIGLWRPGVLSLQLARDPFALKCCKMAMIYARMIGNERWQRELSQAKEVLKRHRPPLCPGINGKLCGRVRSPHSKLCQYCKHQSLGDTRAP